MNAVKSLTITGLGGVSETVKYEFGHGVFALVAPNGSGKSTVIEALRFALTGETKSEFINSGCTKGIVEVAFSDGSRIRRVATPGVTRAKVKSSLNGKSAAKEDIAKYLYGETSDNALMLTAGDFENDPDGPAGKILMSYMDSSISNEDAIGLILQDCNQEEVKEAVLAETFPDRLCVADVKQLSAVYTSKRQEEKRVAKELKTILSNNPAGQEGDIEELSKALDAAKKAETDALVAAGLMENWEKHHSARERMLMELGALDNQIREAEEACKKYGEGMRTTEKISADISANLAEQAAVEAKGRAEHEEIQRLTSLVKDLSSGVCPILLSYGAEDNRCSSDLSSVLASVKKDGLATVEKKKQSLARMEELKKVKESLDTELSASREKEQCERNLGSLRMRRESLAASIIPEEPKPAVADVESARQARMEAEKQLSLATAAKDNARINDKIKESSMREKMADLLVKGFASDGPVCAALFSEYMEALTQAAEESSEVCGIRIRFTADGPDGFAVEFDPDGRGLFRKYKCISGGEKSLACIAVADIMSRLCGNGVLIADNLERMDGRNLDRAADLVSRIAENYGTILMAAAEHPGACDILESHGITLIYPTLGTDVGVIGKDADEDTDVPDVSVDTPLIRGDEENGSGKVTRLSSTATTVIEE